MDFVKPGFDQDLLLRCLLETVHQGVTVVDKDLDIVLVNATAMKILDIPADVIGQNPSLEHLFRYNAKRGDYGPGDPEVLVRERLALARRCEAHDFERSRPDGSTVRIQGTPIKDGGFVTIYSDVTRERKQEGSLKRARAELAERLDKQTRQLKQSRDLLLNAVNAIQDGLGIANADGQVILANDKMKEIYPGFIDCIEKKQTVSEVIRTVFPNEPDRDVDAIMNDGAMWQEKRFPDGKWYRIDRTRSTDGGIISVYSDITDYKKQQTALQRHTDEFVRLLQQEKKLTEMQREFVSMASHEFRTPLAIIDSNAQRLKRKIDDLDPETVLERVQRIRDSVARMQYLINRFLSFSQTQSVGMEVDIQISPFQGFLRSICDSFAESCSSHELKVDIDNLPEYYKYDQKLLEVCLTNLLANAVKYSPGSDIVHLYGKVTKSRIEIYVEDNGIGIPTDEIPKIFDRYFRASTSSGIAGTGIGLNMAAKIAEKHNGKIEVSSEVGKGSRMLICLPRLPECEELTGESAA